MLLPSEYFARAGFIAATVMIASVVAGAEITAPNASEKAGSSCCMPGQNIGRLASAAAAVLATNMRAEAGDDPAKAVLKATPEGMVWIPGGEFLMGSADPLARSDEVPVHRVRVDGFWIDATEVTNAQFAAFVKATSYKTIAERDVDWEELKKQVPPGTAKPAAEMLKAGSLVFTPPDHEVDLRSNDQWWSWTTGADWRHPDGPKSNIEGKDNYPVVQIAYDDAVAYCKWAGKTLPTEAQWEFAARGGLNHKVNTWGDEPVDAKRCNTWQGKFPKQNTAEDGFATTAPVKSFSANGYGVYDMAGNVWEWCSDLYRPDTYARQLLAAGGKEAVIVNPKGPEKSYDPRNANSPESRVQRGGSFLCNDSYCASYRPSARMACPPDTAMPHLGFRCVTTAEAWDRKREPIAEEKSLQTR